VSRLFQSSETIDIIVPWQYILGTSQSGDLTLTLTGSGPLTFCGDRSADRQCSAESAVPFSGKTLRSCCTRGFQLTERFYAPEQQNPSHTHANAFIEVTLKGQYILYRGQKKQTCLPWTMIYHPPDEPHSHFVPGNGVRVMLIEIDGQELRWIRDCCSLAQDSLVFDNGRRTWSAARVYQELLHPDEISPMILEGLTLEPVSYTHLTLPTICSV